MCVCIGNDNKKKETKNDRAETKDPKKSDLSIDFTGDHLQMKQPKVFERKK